MGGAMPHVGSGTCRVRDVGEAIIPTFEICQEYYGLCKGSTGCACKQDVQIPVVVIITPGDGTVVDTRQHTETDMSECPIPVIVVQARHGCAAVTGDSACQ